MCPQTQPSYSNRPCENQTWHDSTCLYLACHCQNLPSIRPILPWKCNYGMFCHVWCIMGKLWSKPLTWLELIERQRYLYIWSSVIFTIWSPFSKCNVTDLANLCYNISLHAEDFRQSLVDDIVGEECGCFGRNQIMFHKLKPTICFSAMPPPPPPIFLFL